MEHKNKNLKFESIMNRTPYARNIVRKLLLTARLYSTLIASLLTKFCANTSYFVLDQDFVQFEGYGSSSLVSSVYNVTITL